MLRTEAPSAAMHIHTIFEQGQLQLAVVWSPASAVAALLKHHSAGLPQCPSQCFCTSRCSPLLQDVATLASADGAVPICWFVSVVRLSAASPELASLHSQDRPELASAANRGSKTVINTSGNSDIIFNVPNPVSVLQEQVDPVSRSL